MITNTLKYNIYANTTGTKWVSSSSQPLKCVSIVCCHTRWHLNVAVYNVFANISKSHSNISQKAMIFFFFENETIFFTGYIWGYFFKPHAGGGWIFSFPCQGITFTASMAVLVLLVVVWSLSGVKLITVVRKGLSLCKTDVQIIFTLSPNC